MSSTLKKIELILWFKCNCRCAFCVVDAETARQSMTTAEAVRHMGRARKEGASAVDFGGGEPTLRDDLAALVRAAAAFGYSDIGVKSNGLMFCYPEYVETLRRAGADRFSVSVWGDCPSVHDALCRTPGAFEKMEMGIKNVVDSGGDPEAEVLLTVGSVPRLGRIVGAFADIGVKRFRFWLYSLFGADSRFPELLPTLTDAGAAISRTSSSFASRGLIFSTSHVPPCFLRARGVYAPIADEGLRIITPGGAFAAERSPFEAGVKTRRCAGCSHADRCGGVRHEYLQRFSDAEITPI